MASQVGEAKRAFRSLAYHKLKGAPIFLEWAPVGLLTSQAAAGGDVAGGTAAGGAKEDDEAAAAAAEEGCTIFVKNLSFTSRSDDLRAAFEPKWRVRSATVVTKKDVKNGGKAVSMGYGFVEFRSPAEAQRALREATGLRLHDHVLQMQLSTSHPAAAAASASAARAKRSAAAAATGATVASDGKQPSSSGNGSGSKPGAESGGGGKGKPSEKLLVRNLPFQANAKEVKELFATFGQLKKVHACPEKPDAHPWMP